MITKLHSIYDLTTGKPPRKADYFDLTTEATLEVEGYIDSEFYDNLHFYIYVSTTHPVPEESLPTTFEELQALEPKFESFYISNTEDALEFLDYHREGLLGNEDLDIEGARFALSCSTLNDLPEGHIDFETSNTSFAKTLSIAFMDRVSNTCFTIDQEW